MARSLSDAKVRAAKPREKPYKLSDGEGLFLLIRPSGSRLWRWRYWLDGREQLFAVGHYPAMGLGDARKAVEVARELVRQGLNPAHERQAERDRNIAQVKERQREAEGSFARVAEAWFEAGEWAPSTRSGKRGRLDSGLIPRFGTRPIAKITQPEIREFLLSRDRWAAVYMRSDLNQIFDFAIIRGYTDSNPIPGLRGLVKTPRSSSKAALTREQIVEFFGKLNAHRGWPETLAAFRLLVYTAARPGEVVAAEWPELDLVDRVWRVPAEKMKMRRPHVSPLATQVIPVLEQLRAITGRGRWLFPDRAGVTHSNTTRLSKVMKEMAIAERASPHGWRTTFSTWANEQGFRPDAIELQLAHAEKNAVRATYNKAIMLDERRKIVQAWADYLTACEAAAAPG